jgi:PTH1 family peptidyl-tRNA hydrolase
MRLLVGLGNPGREFEGTRHNAGFMCVDAVANGLGLEGWKEFRGGLLAKKGEMLLLKPQQYMNRSGETIRHIADYYGIGSGDICIAADDVYLAPGSVRIRHEGADGGHNGWKSVQEHLEGNYVRVRLGVGIYEQEPERRAHQPALDHYVLQPLPAHEAKQLAQLVDNLVPNLISWLERGDLPEQTLHI